MKNYLSFYDNSVMPLRKDNLWILSDYGLKRDWINATDEKCGIWPVSSVDIFQRAFVCERVDVIENAIVSSLKNCDSVSNIEQFVTIPFKSHIRLRFAVTTDIERINAIFPDNFEIADANGALCRLKERKFAFLVSAQFCTVRLDDGQHILFAVDDMMKIVWRGKTVEEDFANRGNGLLHSCKNALRAAV